jgi:hypothetical protein
VWSRVGRQTRLANLNWSLNLLWCRYCVFALDGNTRYSISEGRLPTAGRSLPCTGNVVRFPIEERARPMLDLLRELAPDVRRVELTAEVFHLAMQDPGFRHQVDAEAAEYIAARPPRCF